jgi:Ca2+-binding RTX toxin-like protein
VIARFPGACANVQTGGPGADRLTGLPLGDALRGRGGNDVLTGLAGDGCLTGDAGNETLTGGPGTDRFAGGAGNDRINSRDGHRETVNCETGRRDRVTADRATALGWRDLGAALSSRDGPSAKLSGGGDRLTTRRRSGVSDV